MSLLPPSRVLIKRKRGEDPPELLRVHEHDGKRPRTSDFVFSRQTKSVPPTPSAPSPATRSPRPASEDDIEDLRKAKATRVHAKLPEPRKFHISRKTAPAVTVAPKGGVQKRSTVFIERKSRPSSHPSSRPVSSHGGKTKEHQEPEPEPVPEVEQARPQKKPGRAARTSPNTKGAPALLSTKPSERAVRLPSGLMMPWDVNSEQLAAEMQAYTLQEIGRSIAASKAAQPASPLPSPQRKVVQSRFKPKKPAMRYSARHPDEIHDGMDIDEPVVYDEDIEDDGDYIIDTYIRMPAHTVDVDAEKNFGLLVLENQTEIDEFYREDSDHEDQEDDEEEDENAEDHYTADYPDDEVESDDEFGRNAYNYRNRNASDLEEFDEDDATFSDDEGDAMRYPWAKNPVWLKKKKSDEDSDNEDGKVGASTRK